MSANGSGGSGERQEGEWPVTNGFGFMAGLIDDLMRDAEMPPEKVRGVSEEWLAGKNRFSDFNYPDTAPNIHALLEYRREGTGRD